MPCRPTEARPAASPALMRAEEPRLRPPPRNRVGDPGAKEGTADAGEEPDIEHDLDRPQCRAHARIGTTLRSRRRSCARCADREHQRAADRMPVGRDHPPAQHVRAALQVRGHADRDAVLFSATTARGGDGPAVRSEQPDHQRRHRLVERQASSPPAHPAAPPRRQAMPSPARHAHMPRRHAPARSATR